jgi:hypothetical protein
MNLHIYYMHYDTSRALEKDRPEWFSYENCLKNLITTISASKVNFKIIFNIVYDGDEACYRNNFISNYFDISNYKNIIFIKAGSGNASGEAVMNIIKGNSDIADDDLVYTLENDYLHRHGWLEKIEELYSSKNFFHYVTMYDHPDKYQHTTCYVKRYDNLVSTVYLTESHHWRTMRSTCFSFITKARYFKEDIFYFKRLRDVFIMPFLKMFKGRILVSAIPALSTHCMNQYMAPLVDWSKINDEVNKNNDNI